MSTSQERAEQSSGYLAWLSYQHRGRIHEMHQVPVSER